MTVWRTRTLMYTLLMWHRSRPDLRVSSKKRSSPKGTLFPIIIIIRCRYNVIVSYLYLSITTAPEPVRHSRHSNRQRPSVMITGVRRVPVRCVWCRAPRRLTQDWMCRNCHQKGRWQAMPPLRCRLRSSSRCPPPPPPLSLLSCIIWWPDNGRFVLHVDFITACSGIHDNQ
jgi:hypothetical protein